MREFVSGFGFDMLGVFPYSSEPGTPAFTMKGGHSEVEWDHHAFLYDPNAGLAVIPFQRWEEFGDGPQAGAIVLEVRSHGIGDALMVSHGEKEQFGWQPSIRRSLMIDGDLVTISEAGVMLTEVGPEMETLDWVAFPGW